MQQFLLRPDGETNNAVVYCLAVAAQRYNISVIDFIALSDHLQYVFFDRDRNAPEFCGYFHRLLAKCMNVKLGRRENFFSSDPLSLVRLEERGDVIEEAFYVATNAVKHGLVAHWRDWPGARGFDALLSGEPIRATRPTFFFAEEGNMPREVTLQLAIPDELGDRTTLMTELCRRCTVYEREAAEQRTAEARTVVGREAVLAASWKTIAASANTRSRSRDRDISPTIAAKDREVRVAALELKVTFRQEYREARKARLAGAPIPFPHGTYWLARFAGLEVAPAASKTN